MGVEDANANGRIDLSAVVNGKGDSNGGDSNTTGGGCRSRRKIQKNFRVLTLALGAGALAKTILQGMSNSFWDVTDNFLPGTS